MKTNILHAIHNRFSPMIFENKSIDQETMSVLFEAATLAASSFNAQPWRFIWAAKGTDQYELLRSFLSDYNKNWTSTAPVLMIAIAQNVTEKGENNYFALFDLGQSVSSMAIQASSMGIQLHQMGGFDMEKAASELGLPSGYSVGSMIALGYPGDKSLLEGHFSQRANEPRVRKSVAEISGGTVFFRKE